MTLLEKINNLTWWNEISKLKDILKELLGNLFSEAPIDGKIYGRKNANWQEVSSGGVSPQDLQQTLNNGNYAEVDAGNSSVQLLGGTTNNRSSYIDVTHPQGTTSIFLSDNSFKASYYNGDNFSNVECKDNTIDIKIEQQSDPLTQIILTDEQLILSNDVSSNQCKILLNDDEIILSNFDLNTESKISLKDDELILSTTNFNNINSNLQIADNKILSQFSNSLGGSNFSLSNGTFLNVFKNIGNSRCELEIQDDAFRIRFINNNSILQFLKDLFLVQFDGGGILNLSTQNFTAGCSTITKSYLINLGGQIDELELKVIDPNFITRSFKINDFFQIDGLIEEFEDRLSAIAGGLPSNTLYKTSSGQLMIV
jgi:hypothetical protein